MFQLFKKRDFSTLLSDTFNFFKLEGKTFFKNYLVINAPILVIIIFCIYLLSGSLLEGVFQDNANIEALLGVEFAYYGFLIALIVILFLLSSIIAYSFPVLYLKNFEENQKQTPALYIQQLKANLGRTLLFGLGTSFIIFPFLIICMFVSLLLSVLIIGIPILILLVLATTPWIVIAYYHYTHSGTSFFTAYGKSFDIIKANFWATIGSTFIIYLIIQVITGLITFIPQTYYYINLFTLEDNISEDELGPTFMIVMVITMIVSYILSFFLNNILLVNQGLIYYSSKEQERSISAFNRIEELGNHDH